MAGSSMCVTSKELLSFSTFVKLHVEVSFVDLELHRHKAILVKARL